MDDIVDVIELNGQKLTYEQFEQEKKILEQKKMKLVEISRNVYKTRLED